MKKILFSTLLFILYSSVVYSQTPCQAMFTYSGTGGSPNIILFTNSSSIGGNPIFSTVSYFWDFGDNSMATVQNPIHTYITIRRSSTGDYPPQAPRVFPIPRRWEPAPNP